MYSNQRINQLKAARQITRQIVAAVASPAATSRTSGADLPPGAPPVPDASTQVDENGLTTYDAIWGADDWGGAGRWAHSD